MNLFNKIFSFLNDMQVQTETATEIRRSTNGMMTTAKLMFSIISVIAVVVIVFVILKAIKMSRQHSKIQKTIMSQVDRMLVEPAEEQEDKTKVYCAYCGTELDENTKKCPHCGANKKIEK